MIFVGEHTSYTHAWIASALESGIRGGVQMLLGEKHPPWSTTSTVGPDANYHSSIELGLVDEAKAAVDKWMARWISVVSLPPSRHRV